MIGKSVIIDSPTGFFQLELKHGDVFGDFLAMLATELDPIRGTTGRWI